MIHPAATKPKISRDASPDTLAEADRCMTLLINRHRKILARVGRLAAAIHSRLEIIFPILNELCEATCPDCKAPCCRQATVTFDHTDLIFLHLVGQHVPPLQPRSSPGPPCHYLGPRGCVLLRSGRPWICTWYICPAQKSLLNREASRTISREIAEIKSLRKAMEAAFIRSVV